MRPAAAFTAIRLRVCGILIVVWWLGLPLAFACHSERAEAPPERARGSSAPDRPTPDDAADEARQAAERAWQELRELYESARAAGEDVPDDFLEWTSEDIQRIGDWEYRVERIPIVEPTEMSETLNEWGRDRWEAYWMERDSTGYTVFLKRTAHSYLRHIPIGNLLRWAPGGSDK